MRLLITGGTGFIGSQLAREARARGHDVVVTGLTSSTIEQERAARLASAGIAIVDGSLRVPAFVRQIVRGCDAVIHLGAAQHAVDVPDQHFFDVNVEGTRLLLESCVGAKVQRFVYGSTIGVYGPGAGSTISEDTPIAPDNIYGKSKAAAESVVRSFNDRIETTIARIGETYGPEDLRLLKLFKAARRGMSLIVGNGRNLHQPIHVQDLVRALLLAVEHPAAKAEIFIFAGPSPITSREMLSTIAQVMAAPVRHVRFPLFALIGAARFTERVCKRISVPPPIHMRRLDFFRKSLSFQIGKARSVLGFEPVISFTEGVCDTLNWYCDTGYLRPTRKQATSVHEDRAVVAASSEDIPLSTFSNAHWRLSDILEYVNDAIIVWEMGGAGILYWNRAAERLYGFSRQQALGQTTHSLLNTQLECGINELEARLSRYGVWIGHLRHRRLDGRSVLVDARLSLMAKRDGRWLVLEVNREIATTTEYQDLAAEMDAHLADIRQARTAQTNKSAT